MRGLVPRWGRGGAWQSPPCQFAVPSHNSGFSYLGVPAPAGTSDCYESMSRTTIRDRLLRQPLIRHSRHPFVNPAPHSSFRLSPESSGAGRGECSAGACPPLGPGRGPGTIRRELHSSAFPPAVNVVRGLVPRWGRGGAWHNPSCQFAVPNHNSGFSYLVVPAPAGTSDCYESMSRTTIRDRLLRQPLIRHSRHPFVNPAPHSSFRLSPESSGAGRGECSAGACPPLGPGRGPGTIRRELHSSAFPPAVNVVRGLVPRWGRGGAWHNPSCQFAVPSHNSGFSYLGVPAPAGMSNWYESMSRTTIRDRLLRQPLIRHSRHPFVNPAPHSSFRLSPESRGGGERGM